jgi:hypothetical protein
MSTEFILLQLISMGVGIAASLTAWLILFHVLRPRLEFSTAISRIVAEDEVGGFAYRVKLRNPGFHAVIDVTYAAKLRIRGLNPGAPRNWEVTYLPVSFEGRIPVIAPRRHGRGTHALVRIKTDKPEEFTRSVYPPDIRDKAAAGSLTLEDVLGVGTDAYVQIMGFGSNAFSGTRREFTSPKYTLDSIEARRFQEHSLELVAPPVGAAEPILVGEA